MMLEKAGFLAISCRYLQKTIAELATANFPVQANAQTEGDDGTIWLRLEESGLWFSRAVVDADEACYWLPFVEP
jgi:hypothetical protein